MGPDGEPAGNAIVKIGEHELTTDNDGFVEIVNIPNGQYDIVVKIGDKQYTQSVVLGTSEAKKRLILELQDTAVSPALYAAAGVGVISVVGMGLYALIKNGAMINLRRRADN